MRALQHFRYPQEEELNQLIPQRSKSSSKRFLRHFEHIHTVKRSKDSHLLVHGYTKQNYHHRVPSALLQIIESYHSMWIHKHFTESETKEAIRPERIRPIILYVDEAAVHNAKVYFLLKLKKCEGVLRVELSAECQLGMEFIAGDFGITFNGCSHKPQWQRHYNEEMKTLVLQTTACCTCLNINALCNHYQMWHLDLSKGLTVSLYIDLMQVTWKQDVKKRDFDITPKLGLRWRYRMLNGNMWPSTIQSKVVQMMDPEYVGGLQMSWEFVSRSSALSLFPDPAHPYPAVVHFEIDGEKMKMKMKRHDDGRICYTVFLSTVKLCYSVLFFDIEM